MPNEWNKTWKINSLQFYLKVTSSQGGWNAVDFCSTIWSLLSMKPFKYILWLDFKMECVVSVRNKNTISNITMKKLGPAVYACTKVSPKI